MAGRAVCLKEGCSRSWPRDPVLEVACPTCKAPVGSPCVRPSQHRAFGGAPHAERDILADQKGHYGACPSGRCGLANKAKREAAERKAQPQGDLFA